MSLLPLLRAHVHTVLAEKVICCLARQKGMIKPLTFKPPVVCEMGLKGELG